jgi:dTDP-4-amino-4,6-dideoxygalactose transaminase
MKVDFFDFKRLLKNNENKLQLKFNHLLKNGKFILGDEVEKFEKNFSNNVKSKYTIGVSNGTDALQLILNALNLEENTEIIVPSFTFIASASVILKSNLRPKFVDIQENLFSPSIENIIKACTKNTRAIIYVHLFGEYKDLSVLSEFCKENNIFLIEDCAQSFGAPNGNFGIASSYSFFPAKNLGCLGDGGAITTNDYDLYVKLKKMRTHGTQIPYEYEMLGGNHRLDTLQAGFLNVLLDNSEITLFKRRRNARKYIDSLENIKNLILPINDGKHSFNQFCIQTKNRNDLKKYLLANGIQTNIYYPFPLHSNKIFNQSITLPNTEDVCKNVLALPIYSELSEYEINYVIEKIHNFYGAEL